MARKNDVLESWIMVEHLAEGDINLKDKNIYAFDENCKDDYYVFFQNLLKDIKSKNKGLVIFFDVFPFEEVIDFLRHLFNLSQPEEEPQYGNKFSFAIGFDKSLVLDPEKTFFSTGFYIRKNKKFPSDSDLLRFEEENKKFIEQIFLPPDSDEADKKALFNSSFDKLLSKFNIQIENCRYKVVKNLDSDETNLHSFFIKDLEKAKNLTGEVLNNYILGNQPNDRINLDSRKDSPEFNGRMIDAILSPKNYPLARFPSNPEYALSLMQQVAVNLAIGVDNEQIRSVNGPPGTGKTTLLKDIIAELVVEQAKEMASLAAKELKGTEETKYWSNASIGIVPEKIAEKGIVVASSNNGAVQNIVNELPLTASVHSDFVDPLFEADYFKDLANSELKEVWKETDGKSQPELEQNLNKEDVDAKWGLFSLEGGRKKNMDNILISMKHMYKWLDENYEPDEGVYDVFLQEYNHLLDRRQEIQKYADTLSAMNMLKADVETKERAYLKADYDQARLLREKALSVSENEKSVIGRINDDDIKLNVYKKSLAELRTDKELIEQAIETLKANKPGLFSKRTIKKQYKQDLFQNNNDLLVKINEERALLENISQIENEINDLQNDINKNKADLESEKRNYLAWAAFEKEKIQKDKDLIQDYEVFVQDKLDNRLDLSVPYPDLQLSNPWFDEDYRIEQSRLFILALRVRKQFLYENRKNLRAAWNIWSKQKEHLYHKRCIQEAWNWINLAIPVISSTFASFSRMCAELGPGSIGYLFVDEAGQALPQASVGAIFRSRQIMVVGDPAQIKPVLTVDPAVISLIGDRYKVSKQYLSEEASTQTLVDRISKYGFYKDESKEEWIGIPLWVHRRCMHPMFDISNKISYGGNMVQGKEENGEAKWFDIKGKAHDKYVAEQGTFLREFIEAESKKNPKILDKESKDIIYVISPFKNVAYHLAQELNKIGFTRYGSDNKPTNVGTVHTFQGKEAPIVFLVLGADDKSIGAASWAMGDDNPNIMNVAVTRAKEKFYIVGDRKLYLNLNSDVISITNQVIEEFCKKQ